MKKEPNMFYLRDIRSEKRTPEVIAMIDLNEVVFIKPYISDDDERWESKLMIFFKNRHTEVFNYNCASQCRADFQDISDTLGVSNK